MYGIFTYMDGWLFMVFMYLENRPVATLISHQLVFPLKLSAVFQACRSQNMRLKFLGFFQVGKYTKLGGGFKHFLFSPRIPGEMIQFDEHIFQWVGSTTN